MPEVAGLESNTVQLRFAALSCANSSVPAAPPTVSGERAGGSPFGSAGAGLIVNKRSFAIGIGVTSLREVMTDTPSLVMPHICRAKDSGSRMQPCEAGEFGTTP